MLLSSFLGIYLVNMFIKKVMLKKVSRVFAISGVVFLSSGHSILADWTDNLILGPILSSTGSSSASSERGYSSIDLYWPHHGIGTRAGAFRQDSYGLGVFGGYSFATMGYTHLELELHRIKSYEIIVHESKAIDFWRSQKYGVYVTPRIGAQFVSWFSMDIGPFFEIYFAGKAYRKSQTAIGGDLKKTKDNLMDEDIDKEWNALTEEEKSKQKSVIPLFSGGVDLGFNFTIPAIATTIVLRGGTKFIGESIYSSKAVKDSSRDLKSPSQNSGKLAVKVDIMKFLK